MDITLWSLKITHEILVRLKAIKYKIDISYYLSSLLSGLAIKPSHQANWFISSIYKSFYYRIFHFSPNIAIVFGF